MAQGSMDGAIRVERPTKTLRELALDKVRDAIIRGHFKPGERLVERDLCAQLDVSRTIVREVLRHLESEGLVANRAGRGPSVVLLDRDEARQIYEIRGALEGLAARLCAEADDPSIAEDLDVALDAIRDAYARQDSAGVLLNTTAFYQTLFTKVGREIAWGVVKQMTGRINHLRSMTIKTDRRSIDGPAQMAKIVDAIRRRNPEEAERATVEHVRRASAIAEAVLSAQNKPL